MHQHVRSFDTDANHAGDQPYHRMRFFLGSLFQPLRTRLFNLLDLVHYKAQSRHVSTKFEKRVWRERNPLRRTQCCEAFRRFAQRRFEVSNTESYQTTLHPVHDARALTNEALTLTVGALRILLCESWNRCHVTVIWSPTQPTDEDAFE